MEINEVKVNSFAPICKVLNRFFFQCKKGKHVLTPASWVSGCFLKICLVFTDKQFSKIILLKTFMWNCYNP